VSDDLIDRLRLVRSPGIGPVTYRQLIARFGSASAALEAVPDLAARGGGKARRLAGRGDAEREIARIEALGARYLALGQGLYPRALAELDDAPPLLTVKGDIRLLDKPLVAIVGARNASAAACRFARQLAYDLGQQGTAVASGLARGIDSAAHDGSLETGTIGVVAGGLDIFYPPENEARQKAMFERGLVLAEMPPGTEPRARHFPYRNRIIASLTGGTVVVEAAPKSGSLITARLAAEAGREVRSIRARRAATSSLDRARRWSRTPAMCSRPFARCSRGSHRRIRRTSRENRSGWTATPERSAWSKSCSGLRRSRWTRSSACRALRAAQCRWLCSSSTLRGGSTGMLAERSASALLDEPNPRPPPYTRMREGRF
jgi:DNA protecting protein DprA